MASSSANKTHMKKSLKRCGTKMFGKDSSRLSVEMKLCQVLRHVDRFRTVFDFGGREVAHWFPGHMAKGLKQMKAKLKNVDCTIEIHDARISFITLSPSE
ncbi:hypothetical protein CHARACLAT_002171 [Characodon lateralis]|uniref:Uncharacterized protein n=1 Tax=Characodon lateralis TaxID=208331 RepID=A0ABU7E0C2_9TELE|nr:hypothetical protein [Characodon lateralis]